MMSPKEMLFLYGRNLKGTFLNGFAGVSSDNKGAPLVWLLHIVFLPISLTFGAGIKTFIDILTRKKQPAEELAQLDARVNYLSNESTEILINKLTEYQPKSTSSQALRKSLIDAKPTYLNSKKSSIEEKKWSLQIQQLTSNEHPDPVKAFKTEYILGLKLNPDYQRELTSFIESTQEKRDGGRLDAGKTAIKNYLSTEKNAGKRMQDIIHHYFFSFQDEKTCDSKENKTYAPL